MSGRVALRSGWRRDCLVGLVSFIVCSAALLLEGARIGVPVG